MPAGWNAALIVFAIAAAGVFAGVRLSAVPSISRGLVAFGGGVLLGVAALWILPELAAFFGWPGAAAWAALGFAIIWFTDRRLYPVCPSCSHTHDHDLCSARLHGFAGPLLIVTAFHSFLDGWLLAASRQDSSAVLATGILLGVAAHKLPEGLALGIIVRASKGSGQSALWASLLAESATLAGAGAGLLFAAALGTAWAHVVLALAAGSFFYLGYHAIHSEYQRGGAAPAFVPALTGMAGLSMIRLVGARLFGA